MRSR
ncbi:UNVERIFIED_CONTAM: hypothetical protein GTU68_035024 [Idotea baltica]|jgi:DNA-binding MarR family transcriptional regulator